MSDYKLVALRKFILTSWADRINFYTPVNNYDAVKVANIAWTSPTAGNNVLEFSVKTESEWSVGKSQATNGSTYDYMYSWFFDPRADVTIAQENILPPIDVSFRPQLTTFEYELLINGATADPDINGSYPIHIELAFYLKK